MTHILRTKLMLVVAGVLQFLAIISVAYADDAAVLPKGRWRIQAESIFFFDIDRRFNRDGNTEDVAKDFNANLNSQVFTSLRALETAFGLPAGSASLGRSVVSFNYVFRDLIVQAAYGLTDTVSVGINI